MNFSKIDGISPKNLYFFTSSVKKCGQALWITTILLTTLAKSRNDEPLVILSLLQKGEESIFKI